MGKIPSGKVNFLKIFLGFLHLNHIFRWQENWYEMSKNTTFVLKIYKAPIYPYPFFIEENIWKYMYKFTLKRRNEIIYAFYLG